MTTVVDLDDFTDDNNGMERLLWLKERIPQFKVTLFAIPAETSPEWLRRDDLISSLLISHVVGPAFGSRLIADRIGNSLENWVSFVMHGAMHKTNRECENWTQEICEVYMDAWLKSGFTERGFKAPGWQISNGCYAALLDAGWWVADAAYNGGRRPAGIKAYVLGRSDIHQIHGHLGHRGGHNENELELIYESILARKDDEFGFVRDYVK